MIKRANSSTKIEYTRSKKFKFNDIGPDEEENCDIKNESKKFDASKKELSKKPYYQLHLDIGQKSFSVKNCKICEIAYTPGIKADEELHKRFHEQLVNGISFKAFESHAEKVYENNESDKIYMIKSPKLITKKQMENLTFMMCQDLDVHFDEFKNSDCKIFLYVSARCFIGFLCSEKLKEAQKVTILKNESEVIEAGYECEEKTGYHQYLCGIRLIWVLKKKEKRNCFKTFRYCQLKKSEIAFFEPLRDGQKLAAVYCSVKGNTAIYT